VKKLLALFLALSVALIPAGAAAAAPPAQVPPPAQYHPTVAQLKASELAKSVGPSRYTQYGRTTISGWTVSGKYTKAVLKAVYVSPAGLRTVSKTVVVPNSWYNPGSWDWGHILGATWSAIWNNCAKGAVTGVVGTASGAVIVNLIARGGVIFFGPGGYAAIAIGGCVVNLIFG
jgi:hypothetical protein